MKQCPTCQSQYTDDTLQFCLQDGSPLQSVTGSTGDATAEYGEQATVVAGRQSSRINTPPVTSPTAWNPNQFESNAPPLPAAGRKSSTPAAVFLTVFVMLVLFSLVGIGAWLYFRGATPDDRGNLFIAKKSPNPEVAANRAATAPDRSQPTPLASAPPTASSDTTSANSNSAPVDKEQIKRDVSQKVSSWISGSESGDVDSYIDLYAEKLDYYYKKRGVGRATVRGDKQNAFDQYSDIKIDVSNLSVTSGEAGDKATAVFDKEWVFEGAKRFAGKTQSQLEFKKINGQWLITGERDLKVYYTE